jgi:glycosyltransferase involved in cell wall biosynthesis
LSVAAMKVGLLAPPWVPVPPPSYGGTEAVVDRLARGLVAAGHEVLLFAPGDSTCPVPTVPHTLQARPDQIGLTTVELAHVIRGHDCLSSCDVVHDHTLAGPSIGRRRGAPAMVTTSHGPFTPEVSDVYRSFARRVPIIAISHAQAVEASRQGIQVARVIHHGLDPDEVTPGAGDGGYLLFLGRMHPDKGVDAAARVARAAGVPLRIAAKMREPAEREWFEACVKPLLCEDVTYVGEAGRADALMLLQGATALVNPILWSEPFGLVMVEALAAGTPVLAFPNGAAPEIVEHGVTGYLCDDEDQMAKAVIDVQSLDRAACRQAVLTRFSTARVVEDHLALYERVITSVRQGRAAVDEARSRPPHQRGAR